MGDGPRILSVLPLPPHYLLLRVGTSPDESARDDDPDADTFTDTFVLVSLAGLPGLSTIAAHWGLVRQARVVAGGRAVAWDVGAGGTGGAGAGDAWVTVSAEVILSAPSAVLVTLEELRALTWPVRRRGRERSSRMRVN